MAARLVQLIEVDTKRGRGTDENPVRIVRQFFTVDGALAAELDPIAADCARVLDVRMFEDLTIRLLVNAVLGKEG